MSHFLKKNLAFLAKNDHFKMSLLFPGYVEAKFQSPRGTKINVNYEKKFHRSVLYAHTSIFS